MTIETIEGCKEVIQFNFGLALEMLKAGNYE